MTDHPPIKRRKKKSSSLLLKKAEYYDAIDKAVQHYKRFVGAATDNYCDESDEDAEDDDEGEAEYGDIDEILEVIEIFSRLEGDCVISPFLPSKEDSGDAADVINIDSFGSIQSILPIMLSMSYLHAASYSMSSSEEEEEVFNLQPPLNYFEKALLFWPTNPAANSLLADYHRQTKNLGSSIDMTTICDLYVRAANYANIVQDVVTKLFDKSVEMEEDEEDSRFNMKELVEIFVISGALGMDVGQQDGDEKDGQILDSSCTVEETSSFMSAMLLSCLGKHDDAKFHMQKFRFSHRIHPNVWSLAQGLVIDDSKRPRDGNAVLFQPRIYHGEEGVLPQEQYDRLCKLFAPDSPYWEQSDYNFREYYSFYFDIKTSPSQTNVVEDAIVNHLLPLAERTLREEHNTAPKIVGCEWWVHTRAHVANLGHPLHFDTDEWLLNSKHEVSHPIVSSVLYLTGGPGAGSTIVFDQTPDSKDVATQVWLSEPKNNCFMNFPGNLLHGVLPCAGDSISNSSDSDRHRLTLMVGFWTRPVTKGRNGCRELYGPCDPLPPANEEHSWVLEAQKEIKQASGCNCVEARTLQVASPAWETIDSSDYNDESTPLKVPSNLDHQYFVVNAPQCFSKRLFIKHRR